MFSENNPILFNKCSISGLTSNTCLYPVIITIKYILGLFVATSQERLENIYFDGYKQP